MALTYGFYNSQDGDRKYDAVQMSSIFDGIIEDGIFQSIGTAMAVTASTGKTVVVGVGRAWFDHTWTLNDSGYPIELPESEVLLDRIDAVVLEVDASVGTRANSFKVVEGSPSSSPQRPSLVDNETTHQHALAYILRKAGTEEVTQADITNVIGTSETPYVTGPLSIITADAMLAQWQSEFDQWFESLEDTLSGDVAANLANQIMQKVDKTSVIDDLDEIAATTEEGYVAGALAVKDLNSNIKNWIGPSLLKNRNSNIGGADENTIRVAQNNYLKLIVFSGQCYTLSSDLPVGSIIGYLPDDFAGPSTQIIVSGCAYLRPGNGADIRRSMQFTINPDKSLRVHGDTWGAGTTGSFSGTICMADW